MRRKEINLWLLPTQRSRQHCESEEEKVHVSLLGDEVVVKAVELVLIFLQAFPHVLALVVLGGPVPELATLDRVQNVTSDFWEKVFLKCYSNLFKYVGSLR